MKHRNHKLGVIALWAVALLITIRLAWSAHQHHMPTADTAVIVFCVPLAVTTGIETLTRGLRAARKSGATR